MLKAVIDPGFPATVFISALTTSTRTKISLLTLKVLGLWLLYAVTGLVIAVAAAGTSSDLHLDEAENSPTRMRTKIVGGVSGLLLALGTIGWFLSHDPRAGAPSLARALTVVGWLVGGLMTLVAWWMIARDLRRLQG